MLGTDFNSVAEPILSARSFGQAMAMIKSLGIIFSGIADTVRAPARAPSQATLVTIGLLQDQLHRYLILTVLTTHEETCPYHSLVPNTMY